MPVVAPDFTEHGVSVFIVEDQDSGDHLFLSYEHSTKTWSGFRSELLLLEDVDTCDSDFTHAEAELLAIQFCLNPEG